MDNVFYVIETEENWFQVRLIHNHFVMSAVGSKKKALECVYTLVRRYKDKIKLDTKLVDIAEGLKEMCYIDSKNKEKSLTISLVNPESAKLCAEEYEKYKNTTWFKEIQAEVSHIIRKALYDMLCERPVIKNSKKIKLVPMRNKVEMSEEIVPEIVVSKPNTVVSVKKPFMKGIKILR